MKTVVQGGDAVKLYTRRDSATAVLKKLGVQASEYNLFIQQTTDGRYAVQLDRAAEHLQAKLRLVATEVIPQAKNLGKTVKQAESNQVKRPAVSAAIRKLILDGLDNKQIHEVMKAEYGHDEDKQHYPGWYRSRMRREGLVPKPEKKTKPLKEPKAAKAPTDTPVKPKAKKLKKRSRSVTTTQPVKKKSAKLAQQNIDQTAAASFKTGNTLETVAPHSHIQVK